MTPKKKDRGMSIVLPSWWLDDLRPLASKKAGWTQERLAKALTKIYGRATEWDHKTVGNFLKGKHATIEMMEAFCALFEALPPCQFRARHRREAMQLQSVARGADTPPETAARLAMLDRGMREHQALAADQTAALDYADEAKRAGSRRRSGVERSRPPASRS
jgi:hypothetical protein